MIAMSSQTGVPTDHAVIGVTSQVSSGQSYHRLKQVRIQEEISLRTMARMLGVSIAEARRQECETTDLPLSQLYRWAELMKVPVVELLAEPSDELSLPLMKRARMVRLMKTAAAILEQTRQSRIKHLAQMLVEQLTEIMPELHDVRPWNSGGKKRSSRDLGQAFLNRLSASLFVEDVERT